jgi:hypothetical protein
MFGIRGCGFNGVSLSHGNSPFCNPASHPWFFDRQGWLMVTPRAMNYYLRDYKK